MHIVVLLYQSADGSSHRDNIIVWVWREYDNLLREWCCTLRAIGIIGIRLTTWPSGNGMLQVIENLDIGIVGRAIESQKFAQSVLIIILIGQLQDRLVQVSGRAIPVPNAPVCHSTGMKLRAMDARYASDGELRPGR